MVLQLSEFPTKAGAGNIDLHWATSIFWVDLPQVDNQALIEAMLQRRKEPNYAGGYTTYYDHPQLHQESPFQELTQIILLHALAYMPPRRGRLELQKGWCSIMPPGGYHPVHAHPLSYISGTYYPKTLGQIVFHDPRVGAVASSFTRDPIISYQAKAGRLILFPSWLLHEVPVNLTDEERFSYSFNIHNPQD